MFWWFLQTDDVFLFVSPFKMAFYEVIPKYKACFNMFHRFNKLDCLLSTFYKCILYVYTAYLCVAVLADGDWHCTRFPGCYGHSVDGSELGTEAWPFRGAGWEVRVFNLLECFQVCCGSVLGMDDEFSVHSVRESVYRLLPQTTPENISKNYSQYSLDPSTRYPNLNTQAINASQVGFTYTHTHTRTHIICWPFSLCLMYELSRVYTPQQIAATKAAHSKDFFAREVKTAVL